MYRQSEKKLVKQQYLRFSTCPHGELQPTTAEIGSDFGAPLQISTGFAHGTLVVGVSQTLRHWTEGATYIRHGGHHVGHWRTF